MDWIVALLVIICCGWWIAGAILGIVAVIIAVADIAFAWAASRSKGSK